MAVPHVTGALARIWADFPNCKSEVVRQSIEETARDLGPSGKDSMYGHGLLQTEAAYMWMRRQPCAQAGFTPERGQKQQIDEQRQQQEQGQQQGSNSNQRVAGNGTSEGAKPRNLKQQSTRGLHTQRVPSKAAHQ